MLVSNPTMANRKGGTVGLPLSGVAVRVVDQNGKPCPNGEIGGIEVKGLNVFQGYWRMPEKLPRSSPRTVTLKPATWAALTKTDI